MNTSADDSRALPLYQQVADRLTDLIEAGIYVAGSAVPSVRRLSSDLGVSITTVLEAYRRLEEKGILEARARSGFYVACPPDAPPSPKRKESCRRAADLSVSELVLRVRREVNHPDLLPLGAAVPGRGLRPVAALNRHLVRAIRQNAEESQDYDLLAGNIGLRREIARLGVTAGCSFGPDDIIITTGCQEALFLALHATTRRGDTVAVETPTYFGLLEALEALGLAALEVATDPETGICLEELTEALDRDGIRAVALAPTFNNPLGHTMPAQAKRELVELLAERGVPLIEDDINGELSFDGRRPPAAKSFDTTGNVILCSSVSKTLAPGYRVGWIVPGQIRKTIERLKYASTVASPTPTQLAVASYLASGSYDRHLRRLVRAFDDNVRRMSAAVGRSFPEGTCASRPTGGHTLWIELPPQIDGLALYERGLEHGISTVPGPVFSATGRFRNCLRLNCGLELRPEVEAAVATLGRLATAAR